MHMTHQTALETKHASLDRRLSEELHRPQPDTALIADLKRRKLRIKEEIAGI